MDSVAYWNALEFSKNYLKKLLPSTNYKFDYLYIYILCKKRWGMNCLFYIGADVS